MNSEVLTIELDRDVLEPGDTLTGRYRIDPEFITSDCQVTIRVYWHSMGKGDKDWGDQTREVRTVQVGSVSDELNGEFSAELPPSPLSYDGLLLKIIESRCELNWTGRPGRKLPRRFN